MKEIYRNIDYTKEELKIADMHVDTKESDGALFPEEVVDLALEKGLDAVAILDHDTIKGGEKALNYARQKNANLEVIVGSEVTAKGFTHIGALYLKEDVPSGLSVEETIQAIHKQGGLAIGVHPFVGPFIGPKAAAFTGFYLTEDKISSIIINKEEGVYFDGFEVFNAGVENMKLARLGLVVVKDINKHVIDYYMAYKGKLGAAIGGSDAHYMSIGQGLTGYKGDLKQSIKLQETIVFSRLGDAEEERSAQDRLNRAARAWVYLPFKRVYNNLAAAFSTKEEEYGG